MTIIFKDTLKRKNIQNYCNCKCIFLSQVKYLTYMLLYIIMIKKNSFSFYLFLTYWLTKWWFTLPLSLVFYKTTLIYFVLGSEFSLPFFCDTSGCYLPSLATQSVSLYGTPYLLMYKFGRNYGFMCCPEFLKPADTHTHVCAKFSTTCTKYWLFNAEL